MSQNDGTEWRQRIQAEAEHFIDVSAMTSDVIAKMINEDKIQVLINLNGYTKVILSRLSITPYLSPCINFCPGQPHAFTLIFSSCFAFAFIHIVQAYAILKVVRWYH